jgi:hypothetical protein
MRVTPTALTPIQLVLLQQLIDEPSALATEEEVEAVFSRFENQPNSRPLVDVHLSPP